MTRWIVVTHETLVSIALWLWVAMGILFGIAVGGLLGVRGFPFVLVIGLCGLAAFLSAAVLFGAGLILGEIFKELVKLRKDLSQYQAQNESLSDQRQRSASNMAGQTPTLPATRTPSPDTVDHGKYDAVEDGILDDDIIKNILKDDNIDIITNKKIFSVKKYQGSLRNLLGAIKILFEDGSIELRIGSSRRVFSSEEYLKMAERSNR